MYDYYDDERQQDTPFEQFGTQFGPPYDQDGAQFGPPAGLFGEQEGRQFGAAFGPPPGPPPATTFAAQVEEQEIGVQAVDPGAIRFCRFRFTFVRLTNGRRFWMWPVFVGRRSVAGWRWTGTRWVFFGIDLRFIASFQCF